MIRYAENSNRLSRMLAKKPFSSRDLLVKHVEFAAEFGECAFTSSSYGMCFLGAASALRSQSLDMTVVEYHNLDIIVVFGLFIFFSVFIISKIALKLLSCTGERKMKID